MTAGISASLLVKTAVAGEAANCGQVVMAGGKAGELALPTGWRFGSAMCVSPSAASAIPLIRAETTPAMRRDEIVVKVDLGLGAGTATVWICDLTKDYVTINSDYRN